MDKQTKIVLILLVIIVLLFAGTVGLGFRKGNNNKGSTKSKTPVWAKWLGFLPSPIPSVALKEMSLDNNTLKKNGLTINKMVVVTFLASNNKKKEHRKVDVKWISGSPVTLSFEDNSPPGTDEKPKNPIIGPNEMENRIIVSRAGGSLTLTQLGQSVSSVEFVGSE